MGTLIKSKNAKNRRTSIRFYGKSVLLFGKFFFTIEIVAQFSSKLKKKLSSSDERFGFYSHFKTSTLIKSKNLKNREKSPNFDTILQKICIIFWQFFFTIEIVA